MWQCRASRNWSKCKWGQSHQILCAASPNLFLCSDTRSFSVKNIRYYKSQPWGFDSNLLLGYFCELDDEGDVIRLDEEELACAEWVDFEDVPDDPEGLSLTREMMLCFRDIMNASESTCLHD